MDVLMSSFKIGDVVKDNVGRISTILTEPVYDRPFFGHSVRYVTFIGLYSDGHIGYWDQLEDNIRIVA